MFEICTHNDVFRIASKDIERKELNRIEETRKTRINERFCIFIFLLVFLFCFVNNSGYISKVYICFLIGKEKKERLHLTHYLSVY